MSMVVRIFILCLKYQAVYFHLISTSHDQNIDSCVLFKAKLCNMMFSYYLHMHKFLFVEHIVFYGFQSKSKRCKM